MTILEIASGKDVKAVIKPVQEVDLKEITQRRYFFNWKAASRECEIYKLTIKGDHDIKGLIALVDHPAEKRIEIKLLAASREMFFSEIREKSKKNTTK